MKLSKKWRQEDKKQSSPSSMPYHVGYYQKALPIFCVARPTSSTLVKKIPHRSSQHLCFHRFQLQSRWQTRLAVTQTKQVYPLHCLWLETKLVKTGGISRDSSCVTTWITKLIANPNAYFSLYSWFVRALFPKDHPELLGWPLLMGDMVKKKFGEVYVYVCMSTHAFTCVHVHISMHSHTYFIEHKG